MQMSWLKRIIKQNGNFPVNPRGLDDGTDSIAPGSKHPGQSQVFMDNLDNIKKKRNVYKKKQRDYGERQGEQENL